MKKRLPTSLHRLNIDDVSSENSSFSNQNYNRETLKGETYLLGSCYDFPELEDIDTFFKYSSDIKLAIQYYILVTERLSQEIVAHKNQNPSTKLELFRNSFSLFKKKSISENKARKTIQGPLQALFMCLPKEISKLLTSQHDMDSQLCWVEYNNERRLALKEDALLFRDMFYQLREKNEYMSILFRKTLSRVLLPTAIISAFITALSASKEYEKIPINSCEPDTTYPAWFANIAVITTLNLNNYLISASILALYFVFSKPIQTTDVTMSSGKVLTKSHDLTKTHVIPFKLFTFWKGNINNLACDKLEKFYDAYNLDTVSGERVTQNANVTNLGNFVGYINSFLTCLRQKEDEKKMNVLTPSIFIFELESEFNYYDKLVSRQFNSELNSYKEHKEHNQIMFYDEYIDFEFKNKFLDKLKQVGMIGLDIQLQRLSILASYLKVKFSSFLDLLEEQAEGNPYSILSQDTLEAKSIEAELNCNFPVILQGPPGTGKSEIQTKFSSLLSDELNTLAKDKQIRFFRSEDDLLVAAVGEKALNLIQRQIDQRSEDKIFYFYKPISEIIFKNIGLAFLFVLLISTHDLREKNSVCEFNEFDSQGDYIPEGRLYSKEYNSINKVSANIIDPGIKFALVFAIISAAIHRYIIQPKDLFTELNAFGLSLIDASQEAAFNLATHSHIDFHKAKEFSQQRTFRQVLLFGPSNDTDLKNLDGDKEIIIFNSNKPKTPVLSEALKQKIRDIYDDIYNFFSTIYPHHSDEIDFDIDNEVNKCMDFFELDHAYKIDRQVFFSIRKYFISVLFEKIKFDHWPVALTNLLNNIEDIERFCVRLPSDRGSTSSTGFVTPTAGVSTPISFRSPSQGNLSPSRSQEWLRPKPEKKDSSPGCITT